MGVCCSTRDTGRVKPNVKAVSEKSKAALSSFKQQQTELEIFVEKTIALEKPWTDPQFEPKISSLVDPKIDVNADKAAFVSYSWKRASEIYPSPAIFKGGIEPNDINQGALGDCYFLAALSSLAEFPERVQHMFVTKEVNKAGIYLIRFFLNGQETLVTVDDHLPVNAKGSPAFATSRDGELWVSLLEKAWAKLHGTYARTEGGLPCFAASHIMGVPSESYHHDMLENTEDFFEMLKSADRRNFIMMAASHGQGENRNEEGVISGHAYSLISIHEIKDASGKEVKLLKLRNPWGKGEWSGDWSDGSSLWTPALKKQVNFSSGDDGIFFIALEDYIQHFSWTSICVENNDEKYKHSQLYHSFGAQDTSPMPQAFFSFTLANPVDFHQHAFAISVLQQGARLANYRQVDPRKLFEPTNFNIVLMTESGEFVNARFGNRFTFSLLNDHTSLKPGKYIIMIDPLWNQTTDNDAMYREVLVDIYAPEVVHLDQVADAQGMQYLAKALKHAAKTRTDQEAIQHYLNESEDYGNDVYRISDVECLNCWYGFVYTANNSKYELLETVRPQLEGLEVVYPDLVDDTDVEISI